jgi:hypothetical protein
MTAIATSPTLLTIPQAAKVMSRAYTTVRGWVANDAMPVPVHKINGHHFVLAADLRDFLRIDDDAMVRLLNVGANDTTAVA